MPLSNYPPGVSGREYPIAGPDSEDEIDGPCTNCGKNSLMIERYAGEERIYCLSCEYQGDWEDIDYGFDEEAADDARHGI